LPNSIDSSSPAATRALAAEFAASLGPGDVVALTGDLGTGKTVFARGVITALCGPSVQFQGSPSFAIVQEYEGPCFPVYHFDFYRLKHARELLHIGWDEYLGGHAVCLVEWADRFPELLPPNTRHVSIHAPDAETRVIEMD
jgi:tRNA threonylcarbamoyladenosine biosynthesis protein TsaE